MSNTPKHILILYNQKKHYGLVSKSKFQELVFCLRIFSGLMSLWIIFLSLSWRYFMPCNMSSRNPQTSCSFHFLSSFFSSNLIVQRTINSSYCLLYGKDLFSNDNLVNRSSEYIIKQYNNTHIEVEKDRLDTKAINNKRDNSCFSPEGDC